MFSLLLKELTFIFSLVSKFFSVDELRGSNLQQCTNYKELVKPVLSSHSKIDKTKTGGSLMQVESIAEWSILQYF